MDMKSKKVKNFGKQSVSPQQLIKCTCFIEKLLNLHLFLLPEQRKMNTPSVCEESEIHRKNQDF